MVDSGVYRGSSFDCRGIRTRVHSFIYVYDIYTLYIYIKRERFIYIIFIYVCMYNRGIVSFVFFSRSRKKKGALKNILRHMAVQGEKRPLEVLIRG